MTDLTPTRGRPPGSGKYGQTSRVARIPASMTDADLAAIIELRSLILEVVLAPSPYQTGSVRALARADLQWEILKVYRSLGLPVQPTMERTLGIPPYQSEEQ